jgi:RAB6A-GEF complex partner protein 1
MYWPTGAPRVYSSIHSKTRKGQLFGPDDSADSHQDSDSEANAPVSSSDAVQDAEETASGFLTPSTPITPGTKPVENDGQRRLSARGLGSIEDDLEDSVSQAEDEHIISLKISRSGHLFAVVTSTSLTIWQAKVREYTPCRVLIAYFDSRLLY